MNDIKIKETPTLETIISELAPLYGIDPKDIDFSGLETEARGFVRQHTVAINSSGEREE